MALQNAFKENFPTLEALLVKVMHCARNTSNFEDVLAKSTKGFTMNGLITN